MQATESQNSAEAITGARLGAPQALGAATTGTDDIKQALYLALNENNFEENGAHRPKLTRVI